MKRIAKFLQNKLTDFALRLQKARNAVCGVPVRQQLTALDCGAACLAMILSYYGRKTSVAECRESCGIGRDGVTARTIVNAARQYGLRVKAYSLEPEAFKYLTLPAIVHWKFNHFVVVEKWSPKRLTVIDPGAGRRRLNAEEFDADFTGVVLTFEPSAQFDPHGPAKETSWRKYLISMFQSPGTKGMLMQILVASLFLQIFGLALPFLTKILVDYVLPRQIIGVMPVLGISVFVLIAAQGIAIYLRHTMLIYLRGRLDSLVMLNFFDHLLTLPFKFFQQRTSGDLLMRLGSNTIIREVLTNQTLSVVLDGSFVLFYLIILVTQAPLFSTLVLSVAALQFLIIVGTYRRVRRLADCDLAAKADEQSYLVEAINGMAMLKACGAEDRALDRWSNLFYKQLNVSLERSYLSALIETVLGALRTLSPLLLLWFGATQVLNGNMSLGTMLAMSAVAAAFLSPLTALIAAGQQLQMIGAHLDRIADVMDAEPEQRLKKCVKTPRLWGRIKVCNLSFRYDSNASLVLREVSFHIEPGQKIALVGPTGSGKSTLAMLLLGLYRPTQGEILYDNVSLSEFNYRSLRSQFGVVLQEPFLFSGSIRQNIALSNPEMSLPEVMEVAELAGIHDEIIVMPMGYETIIAEGGTNLSGGQRQRLAIARALSNEPMVLVLDEATSHLDVRKELEVDKNLSRLSCTRIVIAHRLSTIRNADRILVMDAGRVVEHGCHEELLALGGYYANLVLSQLERNGVKEDSTSSHLHYLDQVFV